MDRIGPPLIGRPRVVWLGGVPVLTGRNGVSFGNGCGSSFVRSTGSVDSAHHPHSG